MGDIKTSARLDMRELLCRLDALTDMLGATTNVEEKRRQRGGPEAGAPRENGVAYLAAWVADRTVDGKRRPAVAGV